MAISPPRRAAGLTLWRLAWLGIAIWLSASQGADATNGVRCPDGWTLLANTCLRRGSRVGTWAQGQAECQTTVGGARGNLVAISRSAENNAVASVCGSGQRCWIGLNDLATEGVYVWADGVTPFTYGFDPDDDFPTPPWQLNEPNNFRDNEDCVRLQVVNRNGRLRGRWNDEDCNRSLYYPVCETALAPVFCPAGWTLTANTCLRRGSSTASWNDAESACDRTNVGGATGDLVAISSAAENDAVAVVCGLGNNCWIGLNDLAREGTYVWADNSTPFTFGNRVGTSPYPSPPWLSNQPDNFRNGQDCVRLIGSTVGGTLTGIWDDEFCFRTFLYVCETPTVTSLPPPSPPSPPPPSPPPPSPPPPSPPPPSPSPPPPSPPPPSPPPSSLRCPEGWTLTANTCLRRGSSTASWNDAESACDRTNVGGATGDLVAISSAAENDAVAAVCGLGNNCWIGLNDLATEGTYVWADNNTPFTFGNRVGTSPYPSPPWLSNQPDNFRNGQDCVRLIGSTVGGTLTGIWDDEFCFRTFLYVCETPAISNVPAVSQCPTTPADNCNWDSSDDSVLVLEAGSESIKVIMQDLGTSKSDYNGADNASPLTNNVDYLLCFYYDNDGSGQLSRVQAEGRLIPGGEGSWREWPTGYEQERNPNSPPLNIIMNPGQLVIKGGVFSNSTDEIAPVMYSLGATRVQAQLFKLRANGSFLDASNQCFDTGIMARVSSPDPNRFSANTQ
eukprot:jgi/Mesvir1/7048/Mv09164-RA.1